MKKLLFAVLVPLSMLYATQDIEQPISVNMSKYLQSFYNKTKKNETLELIRTSSEGKCAYDPKGELLCTITRPQLKSIIDRDEIKGLSLIRYDTRNVAAIGITIEHKAIYSPVKVLQVFEKSPAAKAGILVGDEIRSIDGIDASSQTTEQLGEMLRGVEGSSVDVAWKRNGEMVSATLSRENLLESSDTFIISKTPTQTVYGLYTFAINTPEQLSHAIKGSKRITIDLRNSAGGVFSSILKTLSIFLHSETEIFTTVQENGSTKEIQRIPRTKLNRYDGDVEIIVDETTRSGSLLFAYAMARYHPKTKIIGNKSGMFSYLFEPLPLHYIDANKNDSPILYLLKVPCGYFTSTENIMMSDKTLFDLLHSKDAQ